MRTFKPSHRGDTPSIVEKLAYQANLLEQQHKKKIIRLQVGQPSTGAPKGAIAALEEVIHTLPLGYTSCF